MYSWICFFINAIVWRIHLKKSLQFIDIPAIVISFYQKL